MTWNLTHPYHHSHWLSEAIAPNRFDIKSRCHELCVRHIYGSAPLNIFHCVKFSKHFVHAHSCVPLYTMKDHRDDLVGDGFLNGIPLIYMGSSQTRLVDSSGRFPPRPTSIMSRRSRSSIGSSLYSFSKPKTPPPPPAYEGEQKRSKMVSKNLRSRS